MSTYTDRTEVLFSTTPHCSTCKAVMPVANAVAVRFGSAVRFTEVDSATDPVTPSAHRVRGVPTFIAIHQGTEVARAVGTRTPQQLTELFEAAVSGSRLRGQLSRTDRSLRLGVAAVFATAAVVTATPALWGFAGATFLFALWDLAAAFSTEPVRMHFDD